ncbi:hypothetical protein TNCV_214861 [Trichonephila clavipes]|nr:hypothetical protein TNCV_214861 [Trichonephila clavipes]
MSWTPAPLKIRRSQSLSLCLSESVLQPGYDYSYRLESGASTHDENKMSVQCDVSISHSEGCFYLLHLESCFLDVSQNADHRPISELSK